MKVLLTGATGFVGCHLYPALMSAGCDVVCATRNVERAAKSEPSKTWVALDVEDVASVRSALQDCDAAIYLVHGLGQGDKYPERESRSAINFSKEAKDLGLKRVVYLGGVLPKGKLSKHLKSRKKTGSLLRKHGPSTVELRAAMIIGAGSISWMMVNDLAARLPAMLLPRWLRNRSYPIAIEDVVFGLMESLYSPDSSSRVVELPGPERIAHRDVLRRVAKMLGHTRPMVNVPVLSPRLSSYWIALVTRVSLPLARELVEGLRHDLEPREEVLWDRTTYQPMRLEEAVANVLGQDSSILTLGPKALERLTEIGLSFKESSL